MEEMHGAQCGGKGCREPRSGAPAFHHCSLIQTLLFLGVYVGSHWVGPGNKIITHTVELSLRDQRMRAESSNSLLVRLLLLVTSPPS